ncbi:hypothetical protein ACQKIE_13185 [Luteibacter sp. NPDC031894]|jgi:type 1 fimbria pilin|uniref:hypothetical protein n=1 Tax=Luteibacter sp. NPDC031894 TaxID=3390572 RepID=UPI003D07D613
MISAFVTAAVLAGSLLIAASPACAAGGRIAFTGSIVERSCPVREGRLDCPGDHDVDGAVRTVDGRRTHALDHVPLYEYALRRDPTRSWRLTEVTYR